MNIAWDKLTLTEKESYHTISGQKLSNIQLPSSIALCSDTSCSDHSHIQAIESLYTDVCEALSSAGKNIQSHPSKTYKHHPGRNDCCKELHADARDAFLLWRSHGSPRNGPISELMRRSRAHFKYALRQCK